MIRIRAVLALAAGLAIAGPAAAQAQGRGPKTYKVSADHAGSVVREVLDHHGWVFVRFENRGADRIVYYRRGNRGRGRGLGPVESFVIRRVDRQIVFVDVPDLILVDLDIRLRL